MIPFSPEPVASLKDRFCDSVIDLYDADDIKNGRKKAPSKKPEHVFDFEDGVRLIISREVYGGEEFIHMSMSFMFWDNGMTIEKGVALLVSKYRTISGDDKVTEAMPSHVTEAGILHLMYEKKRVWNE